MTSTLAAEFRALSLSGQPAGFSVFYSPLEADSSPFAFSGQAVDLFTSSNLITPIPAPPVIENEIIYTPVAPGVVFEDLPLVTIVDTSPNAIIGGIADTIQNAQGRLTKLFPAAITGDGVIERRNGDVWVYDGSMWNNVGPNPGPTIQNSRNIILPYNEIAVYYGRLRSYPIVEKFGYKLGLLTEIDIATKVQVAAYRVKLFSCAVRNFLVTGQAVSLALRFKVIGAVGNLNVTGLSAGSAGGYNLGSNVGTFATIGNAANLLANRALSDIEAGAFDLAGQDAGLEVLIALSGDPGDFILDGQQSNLNKNSIIKPLAAACDVSAQDANLIVNALLVADGENFTLAGQDAALSIIAELTAGPGLFVLTGEAAGGTTVRGIAAEVGSYSLTGQSINAETSDYFSSWGSQNYGYQSLIYPDWWAD